MSVWRYAVHGKSPAFFDRAQQNLQSENETAIKLRAIRCHKTQIKLSRRRFFAYAERPERLLRLGSREPTIVDGSIRSISRQSHMLRLDLRLSAEIDPLQRPATFSFRARRSRNIAVYHHAASGSLLSYRDARGR